MVFRFMLLTKNDKMKAHIRYFILILGIAFLTGCCLQKTHFTAEEMQWLNPYEEGDTLIFQSAKGEVDTSWIVQKTIYHSRIGCNPIASHGTHKYHTGRIIYHNSTRKYNTTDKNLLSIQKHRDRTDLSISYLDNLFVIHELDIKLSYSRFTHIKVLNKGELFLFSDDHPQKKPDDIRYLYWHKDHGIIKYITHEGVEWKRINLDFEVE